MTRAHTLAALALLPLPFVLGALAGWIAARPRPRKGGHARVATRP
jgi:hypothetical protein